MTTPAPSVPPAAALERTRFAWRRTVLTVTVVALLALRQALLTPSPAVRAAAAAVVMLLWLAALAAGHRRITALGRGAGARGGEPRRLPLVVASVTCGLALLGAGLLAVS